MSDRKISAAKKKKSGQNFLCCALQGWQKRSKTRRKSLRALANSLKTKESKLRSLLRSGIYRRQKKIVLECQILEEPEALHASKIWRKDGIRRKVSSRAVRRLRHPIREAVIRKREAQKRRNRVLPTEHEQLSQQALRELDAIRRRTRF